jgi:CheY-like chemotaxis protein
VSSECCHRPVILIDDEEDEIFVTTWRLKKAGIENPLIAISTPQAAIDYVAQVTLCETGLPALVLCDIKLPGMRGYELVAAMRHFKCLRVLPIWMLSNSSSPADIAQSEAAGASGYLVKPVSLPALRTILEGGAPVQDAQCCYFTGSAPPVLKSVNGMMEVAVADVPALRRTVQQHGLIVAEVDRDLRYVWIDSPHPDFNSASVLGRRDDELIGAEDAAEIMAIKRSVLQRGQHARHALRFQRSDGPHCYALYSYPIRGADGEVSGVLTLGLDAGSAGVAEETSSSAAS